MTAGTASELPPALSLPSRIVIGLGLGCGIVLTVLLLLLALQLPSPAKLVAMALFCLNWIALTRFLGKPARPWLASIQYSALRMNWVLGVATAVLTVVLIVKTTPQRPLLVAGIGLMCLLWGAAGRRLSRR